MKMMICALKRLDWAAGPSGAAVNVASFLKFNDDYEG